MLWNRPVHGQHYTQHVAVCVKKVVPDPRRGVTGARDDDLLQPVLLETGESTLTGRHIDTVRVYCR